MSFLVIPAELSVKSHIKPVHQVCRLKKKKKSNE